MQTPTQHRAYRVGRALKEDPYTRAEARNSMHFTRLGHWPWGLYEHVSSELWSTVLYYFFLKGTIMK